jgi:hypothetical protein
MRVAESPFCNASMLHWRRRADVVERVVERAQVDELQRARKAVPQVCERVAGAAAALEGHIDMTTSGASNCRQWLPSRSRLLLLPRSQRRHQRRGRAHVEPEVRGQHVDGHASAKARVARELVRNRWPSRCCCCSAAGRRGLHARLASGPPLCALARARFRAAVAVVTILRVHGHRAEGSRPPTHTCDKSESKRAWSYRPGLATSALARVGDDACAVVEAAALHTRSNSSCQRLFCHQRPTVQNHSPTRRQPSRVTSSGGNTLSVHCAWQVFGAKQLPPLSQA